MDEGGRRRLGRSLLMASVAMLVYAAVAFALNLSHSVAAATRAALVNGAVCFFATLFSSYLMQVLFELGHGRIGRYLWASVGGGAVMFGVMALVHAINGTPALLATLASSALLAAPYYILFPLYLVSKLDEVDEEVRLWATPYPAGVLLKVAVNNLVGPSRRNRSLSRPCAEDLTACDIQPALSLGFVGDLMPLRGRPFRLDPALLEFFAGVEYLVCNFEGSLFPGPKRGLMAQVHETDVLDLLTQVLPPERIVLSCANNHAADFGRKAFDETNAALGDRGFRVIGSRETPSCRLGDAVLLVAATEWSNQEAGYLSELDAAAEAAGEPAAFRVLYPHWCRELELYPNQAEIDRAKRLLRHFDLIVGTHPHTPGVVTTVPVDGVEKMVAWSLGDFTIGIRVGGEHYRWGQVLRAEIGPPREAPGPGAGSWRQGRTRWRYSHVVPDGGHARLVQLEARCPWFE